MQEKEIDTCQMQGPRFAPTHVNSKDCRFFLVWFILGNNNFKNFRVEVDALII